MKANQVTLVGFVGQHLKTGNSSAGTRRVGIRLATHCRVSSNTGATENKTMWHDVVAWGAAAFYAERNFVKGSHILVDGSIRYRTYVDHTGHTRYVTQIRANSLMNLDR